MVMDSKRRRCGGALTVEAAIIVPVIFVLMLPFLYLIRSVYVYHCVSGAMYETAEMMTALCYLQAKTEDADDEETETGNGLLDLDALDESLTSMEAMLALVGEVTDETGADVFLSGVAMQQAAQYFMNDLLSEKELEDYGLEGGTSGISYADSDFLCEDAVLDGIYIFCAAYTLEFPFVSDFASLPDVEITVVGRKYIGQETSGTASVTEESSDDGTYYRIGNGDHYHISGCYLLDKETETMTREEAEARGYSACSKCSADQYTTVVVTEGGIRYHAPGCYHVGGSATLITWDEIVENGYEPCEICIGGGTWFG